MTAGRVRFVGCGPGAADLLTLRAVRALGRADVVVWSPALLDEAALREHARADAEVLAWPPARAADVLAVYDRAAAQGLDVVRLAGGDPTLFGQLREELGAARARGLAVEIVPGVSAVTAAAAALGCELAGPGLALTIVGAAAPAREAGSVGVLGAGRDGAAIVEDLRARGLADTTVCAVVVAVSRAGETVVTCTLEDLAETLSDYAAAGLTVVLAGGALADAPELG
jgi:precorrin-4/cobalt-precorrin-4 C11-methyltransferase